MKIRIKKKNRGTFTAAAKKHGKSVQAFASQVLAHKENYSPAMVKKANFARNSRKWKHGDGGPLDNYFYDGGPYGVIPLGGDYLTYLQTMPEVSGGAIEPSVVTAALPSKFNGSQAAAARYAEGYQKGAKPVSEAMNRAGQDIFNTVDTVVGLTPTPAGALTWLGHMGADAAEGRWGRVGRDIALAAALGTGARGIGWIRNYIDDATNYGEDLFRAFTDRAPGRVSTNFTYAAPATRAAVEAVPAVANAASAPYEIADLGGGYMLKSLMRGNPLEKQISKNGTVNVNNVRALIGKGSKVEQAIVDKVLASEEFAGKKSIDYNKFRKAVQDELITYDRTPNTKWSDYGLDRIGLSFGNKTDVRNAEDRMNMLRERIATGRFKNGEKLTESDIADAKSELEKMEAFWRQIPETETYTFSSSRIPNGSAKHYDANTLGHSRTYTTVDEPDVLHVMESQSDWGQGYKKMNLDGEYNQKRINSLERRINNLKESINSEMEGLRTEKMNDGSDMSPWFADSLRKQIEKDKQLLEELTVELDIRRNPKSASQQDYLAENFTSRQIQENLRYAAEKGQTKMRYPTKETAAKIEGYPKETNYYDADGNLVTDSRKIYTIGKENEKELDLIQRELDGYYAKFNVAQLPNGDYVPAGNYSDNPYQQLIEAIPRKQAAYDGWRANHPNATSEKGQRVVDDMKRRAEEIKNFRARVKYLNHRMKELKSIKPHVDPSIKKEVRYMHEDDILRKYNEFPKQFKKLYKNADVRIVTDPKGNTWYEVDVPENYLKQEWAYEEGGSMILPKMMMDKHSPDKLRKAIANIKAKRMQ